MRKHQIHNMQRGNNIHVKEIYLSIITKNIRIDHIVS